MWWRWRQCRHKDIWMEVHPKRFKIFSLENQLCSGAETAPRGALVKHRGWWHPAR